MSLPSVVILGAFQSGPLFELESRSDGNYLQITEIKGNSILSSVYVKSISPGASIKINYFDTTLGAEFGERFELTGHDLINDTAVGETFRTFVTKIHRRVVCEAIVIGGSAEFSVYATVVTSFATDVDAEISGEVQVTGLKNGGKHTEVTLIAGEWTPIPAVPLPKRNAMAIQNQSQIEFKLNFDPTTVGYKGWIVPAIDSKLYDITDDVVIYGKPLGDDDILIVAEEIS